MILFILNTLDMYNLLNGGDVVNILTIPQKLNHQEVLFITYTCFI